MQIHAYIKFTNNMVAIQKRAVIRTKSVGQMESINGRLAPDTGIQIVTGINKANICYLSACGDGVNVN